MFSFQHIIKSGTSLRRSTLAFRLGDSLGELFGIYDLTGGPGAEVPQVIDRRLEQCLGEPGASAPPVRARIYLLLRAKELHRFVVETPALVSLKVRWLELLLFFSTPAERWGAIRDLLGGSLELICGAAGMGYRANLEHYKQQLSLPAGPLGNLLVGTALFNFDQDPETPPPNLMIRFTGGRFPEHRWEIVNHQGGGASAAEPGLWRPANPLCRWEYLAADLGHTLFQAAAAAGGNTLGGHTVGGNTVGGNTVGANTLGGNTVGGNTVGGNTVGGGQPQGPQWRGFQPAPPEAEEHLYCTFEPGGRRDAGEQVDLFPLQPAEFLPELQRCIHRRFQSEGVRALALVLAQLGQSQPGEVVLLGPTELAGPPGPGVTKAGMRARARKACAVVHFLSQVTLNRIITQGKRSTAQRSNFLTILDVLREGEAGDPHQPFSLEKLPNAEGTQLRLVVDSLLYPASGGTLAASYLNLPAGLLEASPREHPFALGLYVHLRRVWQSGGGTGIGGTAGEGTAGGGTGIGGTAGEGTGIGGTGIGGTGIGGAGIGGTGIGGTAGVTQSTAAQLFRAAGLWVSESARYRSLEGLRRELDFLRERGWLGSWRMLRSSSRDAMDDQFRMEAPTRKRRQPLEAVVSGRSVSLVSA